MTTGPELFTVHSLVSVLNIPSRFISEVYHFKAAEVDKSRIRIIHHQTSLIMLGHIDTASGF